MAQETETPEIQRIIVADVEPFRYMSSYKLECAYCGKACDGITGRVSCAHCGSNLRVPLSNRPDIYK